MKKTCHRCKAYSYSGGVASCQLGYPIILAESRPAGPCPKPLTYLALIEERNEIREERIRKLQQEESEGGDTHGSSF